MTGWVLNHYPTGDPIARGDGLVIPVTFSFDVTGWTWIAQVRPTPDSAVVMDFAVAPDTDDPAHGIVLTLTPEQSENLKNGDGWDLQSVTPTLKTWVLCRSLRVEKDYTHD